MSSSEGDEADAGPDLDHREDGLDLAKQIARSLAGKTPAQRGKSLRTRAKAPRKQEKFRDDLVTVDETIANLVGEQGWENELRVHGVFGRWDAIVGRDVAAHTRPESLVEGRLLVRTDSTAWATQMKLLAADVVRRLNDVLGDGTVEQIEVQGPDAPRWNRGRLRVKGRGPRDTYG